MTENKLLAALPADLLTRIELDLSPVKLRQGAKIFGRGEEMAWVYFPTTCVLSLIVTLENGSAVEAELVGNDGFAGLPALFNVERSNHETVVQVAGETLRMKIGAFWHHLEDERFRQTVNEYAVQAYRVLAQSAVCLAFHSLEQRLARWLLMVNDRVAGHEVRLTHDFLATMLGVQRPSVTLAVQNLTAAGLISHARGVVIIADRAGLEAAACECYQAAKLKD